MRVRISPAPMVEHTLRSVFGKDDGTIASVQRDAGNPYAWLEIDYTGPKNLAALQQRMEEVGGFKLERV